MLALKSITYRNFRNLVEVFWEPGSGINLICGQNAQGKTNLLEGIHFISSGRILRGSRETEAILEGADGAKVVAETEPHGTTVSVTLAHGRRKKAELNSLGLPRASDILGRIPSVGFWSGDLAIVTGDPSARRLFLDSELCQLSPSYLRSFTIFKRALEQRNVLLKLAQNRHVGEEEFEVWESQIAEAGLELRRQRTEYVRQIAPLAAKTHAFMGQGEELELNYFAKDNSDDILGALSSLRRNDIHRGSTSIGPHRDDLEISISGLPARQFGSQGQQRTSVISIKLAVLDVAKDRLGFPPLLLLDDIFSDLDEKRREKLLESATTQGGQVFVTCTEVGQAGGKLVSESTVFLVQSGQVTPQ